MRRPSCGINPVTNNHVSYVAHLERVQYGLRNFDLVFVMQDFKRPPIHINAVPAQSLEEVKDWLDSVDIPFSEGPVNLNWAQIMKTVTDDPYEFYKEGGWDFLQSGENGQDGSDDESSAESAFDPVCLSEPEYRGIITDVTFLTRVPRYMKKVNQRAASTKLRPTLQIQRSHCQTKVKIGVNKKKRP